jgi:hypothetical protein
MSRNGSDLRVLAAAMLEPEKGDVSFRDRAPALATIGLGLVAKIEEAIGQWSTPVSTALEELFQSAQTTTPQPPTAMVKYVERFCRGIEGEGCRRANERLYSPPSLSFR